MPEINNTDLIPSYYKKMAAQEPGAGATQEAQVPSYYKSMAQQEAGGADATMVPDYSKNINGADVINQAGNTPANAANSAAIIEMYQKLAGTTPSPFDIQTAQDAISSGQSLDGYKYAMFGGQTTINSKPGSVDVSGKTLANAPGGLKSPYASASGAAPIGTKTNGAVIAEGKDGTRVASYANGVTATTTPDGTTVIQDPNTHTTSVYTANGYTIENQRREFTDKDGIKKFYWDSTITDPDGNTDIIWGDPHVIGANGKKFDFHDDKARLFNFPGGTVDVQNKSYMGGDYKVQDVVTINVPGLNVRLEAGGKSTVNVGTGGIYSTTVNQDMVTGSTSATVSNGISYYDSKAIPPEAQELDEKGHVQNSKTENFRQRTSALGAVGARIQAVLSDAWKKLVDGAKSILDGTGLKQ